ncbi:hypothetical protein K443DRAFT_13775 [Laccaria amethystina LaAM-08-1]|uniref:Uncharacterized protein n=1 Tax=Laccaria amethystina LaAM-08-1 TaxID=1095629 RepID=A0A0C9X708_9AGAR|nr:hypothetical protein K443DRAFT_13775 [Laccaria amethystina LaAM-08-1]
MAILSRICKTALASHTRHVLHFVIPSYDYNIFFLEPDCAEKTKNANIVSRLRKHLLKMAKKHAKAEVIQVARFTEDEVEAAKKECEGLALSEEED